MRDGNFVSPDGSIPDGQSIVKGLLERCQKWSEIVLERSVLSRSTAFFFCCDLISTMLTPSSQGKIDERFQEVYDNLVEIRNQLDRLTMTHAWSLRETDLYMYQRKLNQVDQRRVEGNFLDAEQQPADLHAQRVCLLLAP